MLTPVVGRTRLACSTPKISSSSPRLPRPARVNPITICQAQRTGFRKPPVAAPSDDLWRLYNVSVSAEADPGKDDYEVHEALIRAVEKKLSVRAKLKEGAISLVRKSFDAR